MTIKKNEGLLDRLLRFIVAELLFVLAFFWLGGLSSAIIYFLAVVLMFTAISGFCLAYVPFSIDTTRRNDSIHKALLFFMILLIIGLPSVGGYYSNFFTKKFFLVDFNYMNGYYKQALFNTGQEKRQESIDNYQKLVVAFEDFQEKYSSYKPYSLKGDKNLNDDLLKIKNELAKLSDKVSGGNLKEAHTELEVVRPIFQDILKRNNFSMLGVTLVDFHDAMEKAVEAADDRNANLIISVYPEIDQKLKAVEEVVNDDEIKLIRANLDNLLKLANENNVAEMGKKAAELKSSFVKVYLKRG